MKYGQWVMRLSSSVLRFNKTDFGLFDKVLLDLQRQVSRGLFFFFGPLMSFVIFRFYKITTDNLEGIRKTYSELLKEGDGPLLICPNHLTRVDSIVQSAFFNSTWGYWRNHQSLPWNLPEKTKFYHHWYFRVICYLGKCIPVLRGAPSAESNKTLKKMLYILNKKDSLAIFPEGKRSRSGFVDTEDFSYGVGQILKECTEARVLCVYLRGRKSGGFADFPIKGEDFYCKMEMIKPKSDLKGLRQVREYSTQVVQKLHSMEEEFKQNENSRRQ